MDQQLSSKLLFTSSPNIGGTVRPSKHFAIKLYDICHHT